MSASPGPPKRPAGTKPWARLETLGVAVLTLALALVYLAARDAGPFQAIEGETLDWRFRLRGPEAGGDEIAIVAIDDRTLAALGRWPFSRARLADAVDALAADGARGIVFDLLLVGPEDETSGGAADRALAAAIARAGNVIVPFAFVYDAAQANHTALPEAIERAAFRVVRSEAGGLAGAPAHPAGVLAPLPAFLAAGLPAHVTVFVEADGSLRFSHGAIGYGDSYFPSLPVEATRLYFGVDRDGLSLDLGRGLSIGERFFAADHETAMAIDYAGPNGTFETWSLIDVAKGDFAPGAFRDRLVLIGPTAAGLGDRFQTPFSAMLPGVEVFANVIDDFLGRGFLRRGSPVLWLDLLALALAGALAAMLGLLRRPAVAMLAAGGLLAAWSALNLFAFVAWRAWLNYTFPSLVLALGAALVVAGLAVRETRGRGLAERRGAVLSRYVSPLAAAGLLAGGERAAGEGVAERTQMAAVMFVDLVGFTRASENMTAAATAALLRRFHDGVERAAQAHGGVIDKFIGDGALVVFGVPGGQPEDAANAVRCARQIAGEVADWTAETASPGGPALACGIGIDFGAVAVAEVGGRDHGQITVAGDTVNVASRLEALTRDWRAAIILSDTAYQTARAAGAGAALAAFVALPDQQLRGRDRPIRLWAWPPPAKD